MFCFPRRTRGLGSVAPHRVRKDATAPGRAHDTGTVYKCALSEISDKAHYPRRKIIQEEERKASKIKAFSKNFSDYFLCFIMSVQR